MRLTQEEIAAIKAATAHAFGEEALVRLFGSRARTDAEGGDIDLHIEVPPACDTADARIRFDRHLFARIEDQRVDVIVKRRGEPACGIDLIAYRDGVPL